MRSKFDLTYERANELLYYDQENNTLRWRVDYHRKKSGDIAGHFYKGSKQIRIDNWNYPESHIIWLLTRRKKRRRILTDVRNTNFEHILKREYL